MSEIRMCPKCHRPLEDKGWIGYYCKCCDEMFGNKEIREGKNE